MEDERQLVNVTQVRSSLMHIQDFNEQSSQSKMQFLLKLLKVFFSILFCQNFRILRVIKVIAIL